MAVIDFDKTFGSSNSAPAAAGSNGRANGKPDAQLWVNVGREVNIIDDETGETVTVFIGLPMGIAADTMTPAKEQGKGVYRKIKVLQNRLHQQVLAACANLEGGATLDLGNLTVQARRVKGEEEAPAITEDLNVNFLA